MIRHHTFLRSQKAFTMSELLVATGVFLIAVIGIVYSYLKCLELSELGRNSSIAVQGVRSKVEEIKNTAFNNIHATYNTTTFDIAPLNGKGVVYVNNTNPNLLIIKVVFCWRQQQGLVIGEDTNLNGALNAGEDKNANGQLDSYVQVTTEIYG